MGRTKFSVLIALAGALVFACSSSSQGTAGTGTCGGFNSTDMNCNTCLTTSCCSEGSTCGANSACQAIYNCVKGCSTDACAQTCLTNNPNGVNDFDAFTTCVENDCNTLCGGNSTGGDAAVTCGGFMFTTAACQTCFDSGCCAQGNACAANSECMALDACVKACASTDNTCFNNCNSAHPNGTTDLNAVGSCLSGPCGSACGLSGGTDAAAPACGGYSSSNACEETCLLNTCCSQAAACGNDAASSSIFSCVQACAPNDNTCIQACGTANQSGIADYNAFANCISACPCGTDAGPNPG
jgi:hypothetical protein